MNAVYFVSKQATSDGNMVVKFGDSRSDSTNDTNYRRLAGAVNVHGNSDEVCVGKYFQIEVLDRLVDQGMALQIGGSESYIVTISTYKTLQKNWDFNTAGGKPILKEDIDAIANQQVNFLPDREVHGNCTGNKF